MNSIERRLTRLENGNGQGRGMIMNIYIQEEDGSRTYTGKMQSSAPDWHWIKVDMDTPTPSGWPTVDFTEDDLRQGTVK